MRPSLPRVAALVLAAVTAACGGDSKPSGLTPNVWNWVPISGAVCSDGSGTGVAVNPSPAPDADVLLFLMGGGACWDTLTCFTYQTATPGPYGAAQMATQVPQLAPNSVFDRTVASNPYKDFTFVFVPYCTGDVHTGDTVQSYPGAPRAWHHKGRKNLEADVAWMKLNLGDPPRVVVSGSSAGGFGSLLAFDLARTAWPDTTTTRAYLVDDSGPPLREIPALTIAAWYLAWDLGGALEPLCGLDCATDMSLVFPALQAKYPDDRLALLSSTQDGTIRAFFGDVTTLTPMDATTFENGLRGLATRIEDATAPGETHAFVVTGSTHTMLGHPADFTSQGTGLWDWLGQQVNDAAWAAKIPPP